MSDEKDRLMASPDTRSTSRLRRVMTEANEDSDRDPVSIHDDQNQPLLGNQDDMEPGFHPKPVPASRARVVLHLVFFSYMVCGSSEGPLTSQYFYHRFYPNFFNGTTNDSSAASQCERNNSDPLVQNEAELQRQVSKLIMKLNYSGAVPMIVATILLGSLSDVIGRRFLVVFACLASVVKQIVFGVVILFDLDLQFNYLGNVVDGSSGSFCVLLLAGFAITADLTPPGKTRTLGIAVAMFALQLATPAGQLTVGYLIQNAGFFYAALWPITFSVSALIMAVGFLPETLPERRQGDRARCVNPLNYVKNIFVFYVRAGTVRQRVKYSIILMSSFLAWTTELSHDVTLTMYQLGPPFCWVARQIGVYGAVANSVKSVAGLLAVFVLQKFFSDPVLLAIAYVSTASSYLVEGFAKTDFMLYAAVVVSMVGSMTFSVARGIVSKMTGPDKQGALFASMAVTETVSGLASNALYNSVYQATVSEMRGAVFIFTSGVTFVCAMLAVLFRIISRRGTDTLYEKTVNAGTEAKSPD